MKGLLSIHMKGASDSPWYNLSLWRTNECRGYNIVYKLEVRISQITKPKAIYISLLYTHLLIRKREDKKILYRMVAGDPWVQIAVTSFTHVILTFQCQSHFEEIMWYMILSCILYRVNIHILTFLGIYSRQTSLLQNNNPLEFTFIAVFWPNNHHKQQHKPEEDIFHSVYAPPPRFACICLMNYFTTNLKAMAL
jgi:hypothetical protein